MPQRVTMESLPQAFEVIKQMRAEGLELGEGYRPSRPRGGGSGAWATVRTTSQIRCAITRHDRPSFAYRNAPAEHRSYSCGSRMSLAMAAAMASAVVSVASRPVSPRFTCSASPPTGVATTGKPDW